MSIIPLKQFAPTGKNSEIFKELVDKTAVPPLFLLTTTSSFLLISSTLRLFKSCP